MKSGQRMLFPELEPTQPTLRDVADLVRLAGLEGLPEAVRRADHARYQEVTVKSALTEAKGMPFRWALNPYRGCTHACQYCYARKYQRHLELGAGDDFSSIIFVKTNLPERLAHELERRTWTRETVAVGTATDPYQPIEGHYRVTRRALDVLARTRTPFSIVTKGPMVVRDVDVLTRASAGARCQVFLSIPSVDEEICARLEPGVAAPHQRLRAAQRLQEAGIETGVLMMPLMPGLTTSRTSVERTIEAIRAAGIRLVGTAVGRLDPGVREFFFDFIAREYPSLLDGYQRLYAGTRATQSYVDAVHASIERAKTATAGR
ncbi:MAG TPA: radical SAM protein [Vicinamibacterales bacterium]|jgi:DNA repair photolyase|nr:radical SAM protein [Vicinamibacterales bacterium]